MSRNSTMQRYRSLDLLAMDRLPQCPTCADLCNPGATVCGECGQRLVPHPVEPVKRGPRGCTCGGNGICTPCVLETYDSGRAL